MSKRSYSAARLGLSAGNATTGTWTNKLTSGVYTLNKAAAATTSVVNIPIPLTNSDATRDNSQNEDRQVQKIEVFYNVTTADLTSAPTAALNKQTYTASTGVTSNATVTQAITFGGIDTIGKVSGAGAAGAHSAIVTITTPTTITTTDDLILTLTMGEAATSVLDITGISVTYV